MHLQAGTIVAKDFRIESPLAQGGMGAVFVATQLSTGRKRALKVMHPTLVGDEVSVARFIEEARIGARIESDHIVEVVGAGIDEGLRAPYLAMEFLEGETLDARVTRRGPMAPAELIEVARQLRHALGKAHEMGIVHRDLKPENLFLAQTRRAGGGNMVKVLDFGIAKLLDGGRTAATQSTAGSPLFMAPEQVDGHAIRPATDVWALGLIAYYALSGTHYWRAARGETTVTRLLVEMLTDPLVAASERAAEFGTAELPVGFDAWFSRCVVRDGTARFADAGVALDSLVDVLQGLAPQADTERISGVAHTLAASVVTDPNTSANSSASPPGSGPSERISGVENTLPHTSGALISPRTGSSRQAGGEPRPRRGTALALLALCALLVTAGAGVVGFQQLAADEPTSQPLLDSQLTDLPVEPVEPIQRAASAGGEAVSPESPPTSTALPASPQPAPGASAPVPSAGSRRAMRPSPPPPDAPRTMRHGTAAHADPDAPATTDWAQREARRFKASVVRSCNRDNPGGSGDRVSISVGFGGAGNVATVRITGTDNAAFRRCVVTRGSSYRVGGQPDSDRLVVRARLE